MKITPSVNSSIASNTSINCWPINRTVMQRMGFYWLHCNCRNEIIVYTILLVEIVKVILFNGNVLTLERNITVFQTKKAMTDTVLYLVATTIKENCINGRWRNVISIDRNIKTVHVNCPFRCFASQPKRLPGCDGWKPSITRSTFLVKSIKYINFNVIYRKISKIQFWKRSLMIDQIKLIIWAEWTCSEFVCQYCEYK